MKLLILLVLIGLFLAFMYWRLRPYIAAARRVLGVVRDLRSVGAPEPGNSNSGGTARSSKSQGERLVRCLSCGIWTPASRALTLGGRMGPSNYYCSHSCLERAAAGERQPQAANRKRR